MQVYFGIALLFLLIPLVIASAIADMTARKGVVVSVCAALCFLLYYILSADWFSKWEVWQNFLLACLLIFLVGITSTLFRRFERNKRIRDLEWDEVMDINTLVSTLKEYFLQLGWTVKKIGSSAELQVENGKMKFVAKVYTSDMPRFYDSEKICNFIRSETRGLRQRKACTFAVISMFNISENAIEELRQEKIEFVFYRNLKKFLSKFEACNEL